MNILLQKIEIYLKKIKDKFSNMFFLEKEIKIKKNHF